MISRERYAGSRCPHAPVARVLKMVYWDRLLSAVLVVVAGVLLTLLLGACGQSTEGAFLRLAEDQTHEDSSEEDKEALPDDEEDDQEDDEDEEDDEWVPGPVVYGEVVFLGDEDELAVVGASVSEFGVDSAVVETNENGRFLIEVENEDPWRLYVSASEDMTPSIWTTSEGAVDAGGFAVKVDLLERAYCEDAWAVDFGMDWTDEVGAVAVVIWKDNDSKVEPEMAGLSVSVNVPGEQQRGLDSTDDLIPVDGLRADASEAELWLVGIPKGTHTFTWTNPDGYECFAPEEVPVLGRTNTWVHMGCRKL